MSLKTDLLHQYLFAGRQMFKLEERVKTEPGLRQMNHPSLALPSVNI